jgi:hypothetical protein
LNNPADEEQAAEITKAQNALSNAFLSKCFNQNDAVALAQQVLAQNHLSDWIVSADTPFTSEDPCASLAIDVAHRIVRLVPVSNPP